MYDIVHSTIAHKYWGKKEKIEALVLDTVNWGATGRALAGVPRTHHHFITKQTVGMSRVGKMDAVLGEMGQQQVPKMWREGGHCAHAARSGIQGK
jgi:hypothetical protein